MTTTSEPVVPRPPRRRRSIAPAAASLLGSCAVHAAFAAAAAGVAWHIAHDRGSSGREVVIRFEDPAAIEGDEDSRSAPPPEAPAPVASSAPTPDADAPLFKIELARAERDDGDKAGPAAELPPSLLREAVGHNAHTGPNQPASTARVYTTATAAADAGVRFAGLGASNARSVVYVVDASGPMVTSMPRVIQELRRSVEQLSPAQKFGVVLFRRTDAVEGAEVFANVLMRATPSAKRRLVEWLEQVTPSGASSPLAGLESALALKPDAVFLLSRSIVRSGGGVWEEGLEATLARLEQLNPPLDRSGRRGTLIQTIQFLDDDPTGIMQAIGSRHGQGAGYRVVRRGEDIAGQTR